MGVEASNVDYDKHADTQDDPTDPRYGEDEPCPVTLEDPNADTYDWGEDSDPSSDRISFPNDILLKETERLIYLEHCCDDDDRYGDSGVA